MNFQIASSYNRIHPSEVGLKSNIAPKFKAAEFIQIALRIGNEK